MNKKIAWTIAVLVVIVLFISQLQHDAPKQDKTDSLIKAGFILPLSGDFAAIGEELKKGIEIAIDQLHAEGVNIAAVYEDDKFDPKQAASAAHKLITVDGVDFASLFSVEEARPIVSIFDEAKIPLVAIWDSNNFLKDAGPYIFSTGFSTEKAGEIMADYAFTTLKLRNVAVISHVDAWAEIISKSFEDRFKNDGGKIFYTDAVQVGTDDFRASISKMKNTHPDGIYFPLIPFDSIAFIKQVRQAGITVPLMSGDALIQEVIDGSGAYAEGTYFTNAYSDNLELASVYRQKYGVEPPAFAYTAVGYDGMMKIGQALLATQDAKTALDAAFGPSRSADRVEKIFKVISGKPVEVKE